jgi:hypothetical protein
MIHRLCSVIVFLLIAEAAYPSPVKNGRGLTDRFFTCPHRLACNPVFKEEPVKRLVLDSTVYVTQGGVEVMMAYYDQQGHINSLEEIDISGLPEYLILFHNGDDGIDSVYDRITDIDGTVTDLWKEIYPVPLPMNLMTTSFDRLASGAARGDFDDFSMYLSRKSCYSLFWDKITREWNYSTRDTLIEIDPKNVVHVEYVWDQSSDSWRLYRTDTMNIGEEGVLEAITRVYYDNGFILKRHYTFFYDEHGGILEFGEDTCAADQSWKEYKLQRFKIDYNDDLRPQLWRMYNWKYSSASWIFVDSTCCEYYSYVYDSLDNVIRRTDSIFSYNIANPNIITHYFRYQTFTPTAVHRNTGMTRSAVPVSVSYSGEIKVLYPLHGELFAILFSVDGHLLDKFPIHRSIDIGAYRRQKGRPAAAGLFLLRITGGKESRNIGEWKVFLH